MLENLQPPSQVTPCKIRSLRSSLDTEDSVIFMEAINDSVKWRSASLAVELTKRGVKISAKTITAHRRNQCSCA